MWRILLERFPPYGEALTTPSSDLPVKTKKRQQKIDACNHFSQLFHTDVPLFVPFPDHLTWRGTTMWKRSFEGQDLPESLVYTVREIAWELSEVGFRVDLYELDRQLVPDAAEPRHGSPDDLINRRRRMVDVTLDGHFLYPKLPPSSRSGLWVEDISDRADALEAFRRLLIRWPRHPPSFDNVGPLTRQTPISVLRDFEQQAVEYYCQTFYEKLGRAPVVPRVLP